MSNMLCTQHPKRRPVSGLHTDSASVPHRTRCPKILVLSGPIGTWCIKLNEYFQGFLVVTWCHVHTHKTLSIHLLNLIHICFLNKYFPLTAFFLILYSIFFYIVFVFSKLDQDTLNLALLILYWFLTTVHFIFIHSSAAWKFGLDTFWQACVILAWCACVSSMGSGMKKRLILVLRELLSLPY